jgi:hypothetical protein
VQTIPYPAIGMVHADPVDPLPAYEETDLLRELPAEAVDALLAVAGPGSGSAQVIVELRQLGGALTEGSPSALCHREAAFTLITIGLPGAETHAAQVRAAVGRWATGGALPNMAAGTGAGRLARSYDPETLARLTAVAERFDPHHVLRAGQVPVRSPR